MKIKNIIFDLGGVIINIDYHLTSEAFKKLGVINFDNYYTQHKQKSLFDDFETGKISSETFRTQLRSELDLECSDEEFDNAWNAMLLDLPKERLMLIQDLRKEYNVYLFSNTNAIHLKKVFEICQSENNIENFKGFFDGEYYSHLFGMKKPNPDSFLKILNQNQLMANETVFVDDNAANVEGAQSAGICGFYLGQNKPLSEAINFIKEMNASEIVPDRETRQDFVL